MTALDESVSVQPTQDTPRRKHDLAARVLAEFAGSFLICLGIYYMCTFGAALYGMNLAFVVIGTGVIYAAVTAIFGKISSAQFNPAITVAAMLTSKTNVRDGVLYILAQIIGSFCAGMVFWLTLPTSQTIQSSMWYSMAVNGFDAGSFSYKAMNTYGLSFGSGITIIVELLASLIVVSAAMVTIRNNGKERADHAWIMGAAYAAGCAVTFPVTGASINPIRATGIALVAQRSGLGVEPLSQLWVFWVSSIFAAAVVALAIIIAQLVGSRNSADELLEDDPAAVALQEDEEARFDEDVENADDSELADANDSEPADDEVHADVTVDSTHTEEQDVPVTGAQAMEDISVESESDAEVENR